MPTEAGAPPVAVFLFAHQDDEFGVYHTLRRCAVEGDVVCAYLTDGAAGGSPSRRNEESLRVLERLGVAREQVRFLGEERRIPDGRLHEHLPVVATVIEELLTEFPDARCYVPAWEGGHPDHDGLHAVAAVLLARAQRLTGAAQYPLYNAWRRPGPLFRVLTPLPRNGPVQRSRLPIGERLTQMRLCMGYPSQATTWLGLFPFVATHLLFRGRQSLQPLDPERVAQRPHAGPLYYEKRRFLQFEALQEAIAAWRNGAS